MCFPIYQKYVQIYTLGRRGSCEGHEGRRPNPQFALTWANFPDTFRVVNYRNQIGKHDENQITGPLEFVRIHFDWSELCGSRSRGIVGWL